MKSGESLEGTGNWEVRPPGWIGADYAFAEKRIVNQYHEIQPDSPGTYDVIATWKTQHGLLGERRVWSFEDRTLRQRWSFASRTES
jgi:hypothetical protein